MTTAEMYKELRMIKTDEQFTVAVCWLTDEKGERTNKIMFIPTIKDPKLLLNPDSYKEYKKLCEKCMKPVGGSKIFEVDEETALLLKDKF